MRHSWDRWPTYSSACRRDIAALLRDGTRLTAQRANPTVGILPAKGSWARRLEDLAERQTGRHAIVCANATLGLIASLKALDLPAGTEVAVPAFTFSATAAAIVHAGLVPHFFDVDPTEMNVHVPLCAPVGALLPVDLFGQPWGSAWDSGPIVQDGCQAVGTKGAGRDSVGDLVCWSMNGRKPVPAGEAGLVLARTEAHAQRVREYLGHGENFPGGQIGLNGHLSELSACVAWHGLSALAARTKIRRARAKLLSHLLRNEPIARFPDTRDHALYVMPLILEPTVDRARLVKECARRGVVTQPGYISPTLEAYPAFAKYPREPLPVTEELSERTLLLLPTQITSATTVKDVVWLAAQLRAAFAAVLA